MDATILLADWAEAINGKLYVQGGGWNRVIAPLGVVHCALAILFTVAWEESGFPHDVVIRLVDGEGNVVSPEPNQPVEIHTSLNVGRPIDVAPGSDVVAPLTVNLGFGLAKGRYSFVLEVDGATLERRVTFDVL